MPRRTDISSIMILGAGPIVIGQACEFDYSGTQACMALKKEGYKIILVNSNPATIMTDPEIANATYIEPITPDFVTKVIEKEKPDALIPTMGGQTALNTALALAENGTLRKFGIELIGANMDSIKKAVLNINNQELSLPIIQGIENEKAIDLALHSIKNIKKDAISYFYLGQAQWNSDQKEKGILNIIECLKIDPELQVAYNVLTGYLKIIPSMAFSNNKDIKPTWWKDI